MYQLSDEEIYQEVGKIVASFDILECYECANAVMQWLVENGIKGKMIRLKTRYRDEDYILSDRLLRQGIDDSITINGKHYGVFVRGKVFDNLSSEGMFREDWIKDFHCPSENFEIQEFDF
ncbi:MAG: papain fold toxin domain-containing protein [Nostoc sp. ChiQUE01a]|nr:papain fold toxin domain-containing protein [Nostoc sp. ChiQUE01a]